MRSARECENEARLAVDYAIRTSLETGAPVFVHGDPYTHSVLASETRGFTVGAIGGYRATTYTDVTNGWVVTAIEAP